jgi:hypothetical protein
MDFIEGLPKSKGYNVILVIVDMFTKYAHFVALKHPFTARTVAIALYDNVIKLHGLPSQWFLTGTKYLLAQCGKNYLGWWVPSLCIAQHIIPKLMGKQRELINVWRCISDV